MGLAAGVAGGAGLGLRASAQGARAQVERAAWMLDRPTVAPLVSPRERETMGRLQTRVETLGKAYEASAVWQGRFLAPAVARCPAFVPPLPPPETAGEAPAGLTQETTPAAPATAPPAPAAAAPP